MPMSKMAVSQGGKLGDFLYACPSAKWLWANLRTEPIDIYTSYYCAPLKRLMEYQTWVNELIVPDGFVVRDFGCGCQPWQMAEFMKPGYDYIHELGFRFFPDRPLPEFVLHQLGIDIVDMVMAGTFEYPTLIKAPVDMAIYEPDKYTPDEPYVIVAPRGDLTMGPNGNSMKDIFYDFARLCPVKIVQIGARGEAWPWEGSIDMTGLDWLETLSWLSEARGFYGIISSQGALAHNFDIPKVFPHNDGGWDMRHVVRGPSSFYEVMPTGARVLELMGLR